MGGDINSIGIAEARSALAWWLEAGVDVAIQEDARDWLKPRSPASARAKQEPAAPPPPPETPAHSSLDEFRSWLSSSEHLPMARRAGRRVLPHGPEQAAVMLLVEAPEGSSGGPISGEAWELTQRMLAAIRIPADQAYSASLSCFHAPGARMSAEERQACGEIARAHIRLAAPKRLILFGDGPSLALLGKRVPEARGHVHQVEGVRTVATLSPAQLIKQPSNKRLAWHDLLLLMEDEN